MSSRQPTQQQRLRHALVSAWRGMNEAPVNNLPLRSVAELIGPVVEQAGLGDRLRLEEVQAAWKEVVGDFLYQHSRPDSIQRGVLFVRVLQPTVHHVLATERSRILARLKARLKQAAIKDVKLKHG